MVYVNSPFSLLFRFKLASSSVGVKFGNHFNLILLYGKHGWLVSFTLPMFSDLSSLLPYEQIVHPNNKDIRDIPGLAPPASRKLLWDLNG